MLRLFLKNPSERQMSYKVYPELRLIKENMKKNLINVRKYFLSFRYLPKKFSILERIIYHCKIDFDLPIDVFAKEVSKLAKDSIRLFGVTSTDVLGRALRDNLFKNGDELYVYQSRNLTIPVLKDHADVIKFLISLEPISILYSDKIELDYEIRANFLDLNNGYVVLNLNVVELLIGFKLWRDLQKSKGGNTKPYVYIYSFVMPNLLYRWLDFVVLNRAMFYTYNKNIEIKTKPKYPFFIYDIHQRLDKCIKDYIKFMTNRRVPFHNYINTLPMPMFKNNDRVERPFDILKLDMNTNLYQTRWIPWATRIKYLLWLLEIGESNGTNFNKSIIRMFKDDMRNMERGQVKFPIGMSEDNISRIQFDFLLLKNKIYGNGFN